MKEIEEYVKEVLGVPIEIKEWEGSNTFPLYLKGAYKYYSLKLMSLDVILAEGKLTDNTPAVISKQLKQVEKLTGSDVIYTFDQISSYERKRLVEHRVSFIIPGNQMYLPLLGVDFREYFKNAQHKKGTFSPSAQTVILYALNRKGQFLGNLKEISQKLNYSKMTISRSLKEIMSSRLIVRARQQYWCPEIGKPFWEKALPFLKSPVQKKIYVSPFKVSNTGILAGLSALSEYTLLGAPRNKVLAFSQVGWKELSMSTSIVELPVLEPGAIEIEIWKYDPNLYSENGVVNQFSLYLSLKDEEDERVEQALENMMEDIKWYSA